MSASSQPQPEWPWPDSFDALVAAPAHHKLVFENDRVRVLEVRIPAGATTAVHTHRWPSVLYTVQPGDIVRRDAHGSALLDTRTLPPSAAPPPPAVWFPAMPPHSVENVSPSEILVFSVELKDTPR